MKPQITFSLEDENLLYNIRKSFGKVIFQNDKNYFVYEVETTDDLHHVEGDSVQNNFPELVLTIEDFPIDYSDVDSLVGKTISIPNSVGEEEDEEGELQTIYYTNLNLNDEEDLECNENEISFEKVGDGDIWIHWKGKCEPFEEGGNDIQFSLSAPLNLQMKEEDLYD